MLPFQKLAPNEKADSGVLPVGFLVTGLQFQCINSVQAQEQSVLLVPRVKGLPLISWWRVLGSLAASGGELNELREAGVRHEG
jgi:hypothetical protein